MSRLDGYESYVPNSQYFVAGGSRSNRSHNNGVNFLRVFDFLVAVFEIAVSSMALMELCAYRVMSFEKWMILLYSAVGAAVLHFGMFCMQLVVNQKRGEHSKPAKKSFLYILMNMVVKGMATVVIATMYNKYDVNEISNFNSSRYYTNVSSFDTFMILQFYTLMWLTAIFLPLHTLSLVRSVFMNQNIFMSQPTSSQQRLVPL